MCGRGSSSKPSTNTIKATNTSNTTMNDVPVDVETPNIQTKYNY